MKLKAHRTVPFVDGLEVVPALPQREWMNAVFGPPAPGKTENSKGFANRCLPLLMANQMGWEVKTKVDYILLTMEDESVLTLLTETEEVKYGLPESNFLNNIVTWPLPWLFETPKGWDLLIKPPANQELPIGVTCLSGLVETDHAPQTFTLNWQLQPKSAVFVKAGDTIATLLPYPTEQLDGWGFEEDTDYPDEYVEYVQKRSETVDPTHENYGRWDKDYWDAAKRRKVKKSP